MLRQLATFVSSNVVRRTPKQSMAATAKTSVSRLTPTPIPAISNATHWILRPLSTSSAPLSAHRSSNDGNNKAPPTITIEMDGGRKFAILDSKKFPKLKPHIVKRRLDRCKTYVGKQRDIRHSPWRMNLICQMIAGLPVPEAFLQLQFCEKSRAPLVADLLREVTTKAGKRHGFQPCQLEVAECFTTKATPLKRIRIMGRGRSGRMNREHCHIRMVLREIDFKLRIYQATNYKEKKKWLALQLQAEKVQQEKDDEVSPEQQKELEELMAKQREIEKLEQNK